MTLLLFILFDFDITIYSKYLPDYPNGFSSTRKRIEV